MPQRVAVGIIVAQMGALAGVRIGKNNFRADFKSRANGFRKRVRRLYRHINRVVFFFIVAIQNDGHLRQALHGAQIGLPQRSRQFDGDHLRPVS